MIMLILISLQIFFHYTSDTAAEVKTLNESYISTCIACACEAISRCDYITCFDDHCGPFEFLIEHWNKLGKVLLPGEKTNSPSAFPNCVINHKCAEDMARKYIQQFSKDCNNDKIVDCVDYTLLLKHGQDKCNSPIAQSGRIVLKQCLENLGQLN